MNNKIESLSRFFLKPSLILSFCLSVFNYKAPVNRLIARRKCPTVEYLGFICDALNVSLSQFFSYEQPPMKKQFSLDTLSPTQKKFFDDFLKSLD